MIGRAADHYILNIKYPHARAEIALMRCAQSSFSQALVIWGDFYEDVRTNGFDAAPASIVIYIAGEVILLMIRWLREPHRNCAVASSQH